MERKEIRERVEKILLKHEENTSEGSIYWDFEWVGGKRIPTGGGGYRQEGGEAVYADKAFYEEMTDFISQELDKAREEGREEQAEKLRLAFHEVFFKSGELWFDYLFEDGDIEAEQDAREMVEEYWEEVVSKLKDNK